MRSHPVSVCLFFFVIVVLLLLLVDCSSCGAIAVDTPPRPPRVLIIGSGINAAATATFLQDRHLHDDGQKRASAALPFNITVVEADSRIGGRIHGFHPHHHRRDDADGGQDDEGEETYIELGASVYHSINTYMSTFADKAAAASSTNRRHHRSHPYLSSTLGVFNGNNFTFREEPDGEPLFPLKKRMLPSQLNYFLGYLKSVVVTAYRAFSRFGFELFTVPRCIDKLVSDLLTVYDLQGWDEKRKKKKPIAVVESFDTAEEMLKRLNLFEHTRMSAATFFGQKRCQIQGMFPFSFFSSSPSLSEGECIESGDNEKTFNVAAAPSQTSSGMA